MSAGAASADFHRARRAAWAIPLFALAGALRAEEPANLFAMARGAVVVERSEYNASEWSAFNLFDDDPKTMWCSPDRRTKGNAIVLELARRHRLAAIAFDNTTVQEKKYPGVSARRIELWVSASTRGDDFRKAATFEAPRTARKEFALPEGVEAERVKLVIVDNWGSPDYTELADVTATGAPTGEPRAKPRLDGIYRTNYGPLQLRNEGGRVTGCYYKGQGVVSGATDGRVLNLEWRQENGRRHGALLMVLTSGGEVLNGLWYRDGTLQGTWSGQRDPNLRDECSGLEAGALDAGLKATGRTIAYGIRFRSDSDHLEADSAPVLREIAQVLKASPALRLRIEGHTDATNTEAYNLDLSRRRARAVVRWLTENGVAGNRLTAEGHGKSRPVADNETPQGRALNRRVELAVEKL